MEGSQSGGSNAGSTIFATGINTVDALSHTIYVPSLYIQEQQWWRCSPRYARPLD